MPYSNMTSVASSALGDLTIASNPVDNVDLGVSDAWMRKQIDYKTVRSGSSYIKYVNLGKFYSKMGHKWKDVTE